MKVDSANSIYQEAPEARDEFDRKELRSLRFLLRRLRFLEMQVKQNEARTDLSGGANFAEWEVEALEFVLKEIGFLNVIEPLPTTAGAES